MKDPGGALEDRRGMNQRRPGANSGMFSVLEGASHKSKIRNHVFCADAIQSTGSSEIEHRAALIAALCRR